MGRRVLAAGVLILCVVAAYTPALRAGFVWDDDAYVVEQETLREEGGLRRIWLEPGATPQYYPLVFTSFWAEYRAWGLEPLGYHLTNVLLHGISAVLLWIVLARLRLPGAWVAAAVFALHPVHVESVAWITERKNVLSGVFYLLALLAWLRFDPLEEERPRARQYGALVLAFACFALALFAKTVTCSLPAVMLLLVWWRRGRVTWADTLPLAPFFVLGGLLARTTARLEAELVGSGMFDLGLTALDRIVLAGRAAWFYLGKLLWPAELVFVYPRWEVDAGEAWQWIFPLAAVSALGALWVLRGRIGRGPLVAALFFGGTLVPALGFVDVFPMTYSFVADHFQYLASLGPIVLVVVLGARALARWETPAPAPAVAALAALVLTSLGVQTWRQSHAYEDLETLWRDVLAKNDDASMAHINLGNLLSDREQYEEAIEHYRAVFDVEPPERDTFVLARARYNTGNQLVALARMDEAEREYDAALAIEPRYVNAYYGRGHARMTLGRYEEALEDFETTLRLDPSHPNALRAANYVKARVGR